MNTLKSKIYLAVAGNPILHSKSPILFNPVFQQKNMDAFYFRLALDTANEAILFMKKHNLKGMSVTAPFKQDMLQLVDKIDDSAEKVGGINTIVNNNGFLTGYNTDIYGVVNSLKENRIEIREKSCLVIGAGGAGMAAAYGLVKAGAKVTIANRTFSKAQQVADRFNCNASGLDNFDKLLNENKIIVSSLSPGIMPFSEELLTKEHLVFDANYKASVLSQVAQNKGCKLIKGEDWLLHQAIPAFEYFLDEKPDIDIMRHSIKTKTIPEKQNLKILVLGADDVKINGIGEIISAETVCSRPDLVIGTETTNTNLIEQKINEEISKTFAC